jgi:glutamate synthase domain-containing protein 3
MDAENEKLVQGMIKKHLKLTGSKQASYILNDWERLKTRFVMVMPFEYKNALIKDRKIPSHKLAI